MTVAVDITTKILDPKIKREERFQKSDLSVSSSRNCRLCNRFSVCVKPLKIYGRREHNLLSLNKINRCGGQWVRAQA